MERRSDLASIIITTHYRNDELERAIDAALAQTYTPIEIIVVDDSGEDHAKSLVDQYEDITYYPHDENQGQIAAWQSGFEVSNGEYIQLHDDDDWLEPTKIEKQVAAISDADDLGVVYCGSRLESNGETTFIHPDQEGEVLEDALGRTYITQTTMLLIRWSVLAHIFPMKRYKGATDIALGIELAKRTKFTYVDEILVNRTISVDSKGNSKAAYEARLEIIDDYSEEYGSVEPSIKRDMLSHTYYSLGHKHLEDGTDGAAKMFLRAIYHRRFPNPRFLKGLLLSLIQN